MFVTFVTFVTFVSVVTCIMFVTFVTFVTFVKFVTFVTFVSVRLAASGEGLNARPQQAQQVPTLSSRRPNRPLRRPLRRPPPTRRRPLCQSQLPPADAS